MLFTKLPHQGSGTYNGAPGAIVELTLRFRLLLRALGLHASFITPFHWGDTLMSCLVSWDRNTSSAGDAHGSSQPWCLRVRSGTLGVQSLPVTMLNDSQVHSPEPSLPVTRGHPPPNSACT